MRGSRIIAKRGSEASVFLLDLCEFKKVYKFEFSKGGSAPPPRLPRSAHDLYAIQQTGFLAREGAKEIVRCHPI